MSTVHSIWKTGYAVHTALGVELVGETEKAMKFKVLNSSKGYTFYMPKKALAADKTTEGILNLAPWYKIEGFIEYLFDQYANHYAR
jgi:hypothetical protein